MNKNCRHQLKRLAILVYVSVCLGYTSYKLNVPFLWLRWFIGSILVFAWFIELTGWVAYLIRLAKKNA